MAPRVRVALLAIAALVLVPGVVAGMPVANDTAPASTAFVGADEQSAALVAVPVRSPLRAVPRALPQAAVVLAVVTAIRFSRRRRSLSGLPFLLRDVGDRWRALLFGAPPALL